MLVVIAQLRDHLEHELTEIRYHQALLRMVALGEDLQKHLVMARATSGNIIKISLAYPSP
jgi:hypothetical protein